MNHGQVWTRLRILNLIVYSIIILACKSGEGREHKITHSPKLEGVKKNMQTYSIGRFSVSVPVEMKIISRSNRLRYVEITEFVWPSQHNREKARNDMWEMNLSELKRLRSPKEKKSPLIETSEFPGLGKWAKGIFYYGNYTLDIEGKWDLLVDYGTIGVWYRMESGLIEAKTTLVNNITNVAKFYKLNSISHPPMGEYFYLKYGTINLPYLEQESTETSFYDKHLDLNLKIEMNDTHTEEAPDEGLIGRTTVVITTGYAAGVDIERIRSRKREIAGLKGEEEVDRMTSKDGTELDFGWRYAGEKNSGERPEILITMDSPDGNLDEKLKIWDAILDSFKPMYKTGK